MSRFLAGTRKTAPCQGFLKLTLLLIGFPARLTRALLSSGGAGLVGGQLRRGTGAGAGEGVSWEHVGMPQCQHGRDTGAGVQHPTPQLPASPHMSSPELTPHPALYPKVDKILLFHRFPWVQHIMTQPPGWHGTRRCGEAQAMQHAGQDDVTPQSDCPLLSPHGTHRHI